MGARRRHERTLGIGPQIVAPTATGRHRHPTHTKLQTDDWPAKKPSHDSTHALELAAGLSAKVGALGCGRDVRGAAAGVTGTAAAQGGRELGKREGFGDVWWNARRRGECRGRAASGTYSGCVAYASRCRSCGEGVPAARRHRAGVRKWGVPTREEMGCPQLHNVPAI